jgi:hypothetical protein
LTDILGCGFLKCSLLVGTVYDSRIVKLFSVIQVTINMYDNRNNIIQENVLREKTKENKK